MCLAVNGGVLGGNANELCRNDDFIVSAVPIGGQNASYSAYITFPSVTIQYVKFRATGARYPSDESWAYSYGYIYLCINGVWVEKNSWLCPPSSTFDTDNTYPGHLYTGPWDLVTGIRFDGACGGNQTGSGAGNLYELQAWANLGGYAGIIG